MAAHRARSAVIEATVSPTARQVAFQLLKVTAISGGLGADGIARRTPTTSISETATVKLIRALDLPRFFLDMTSEVVPWGSHGSRVIQRISHVHAPGGLARLPRRVRIEQRRERHRLLERSSILMIPGERQHRCLMQARQTIEPARTVD